MSNKQRKIAKKKEREKKNKKAKNIRKSKRQFKSTRKEEIESLTFKEETLTLPVASRQKVLDPSGVDSIQATVLYMWDKLKERPEETTRLNILNFATNKHEITRKAVNTTLSETEREEYYNILAQFEEELMSADLFKDKEYERDYKEKCICAAKDDWDSVEFVGHVVDVKYGYKDEATGVYYKNVTKAICLASVEAYDRNLNRYIPVADHMWLYTNRLLRTILHTDSRLVGNDYSIHIGDTLFGEGDVIQYQSKDGVKFGVNWWYPVRVGLFYYYTGKNVPELLEVPKKIPRKACLCQLNPNNPNSIYNGKTKEGVRSAIEKDIKSLRSFYSLAIEGRG